MDGPRLGAEIGGGYRIDTDKHLCMPLKKSRLTGIGHNSVLRVILVKGIRFFVCHSWHGFSSRVTLINLTLCQQVLAIAFP
jgi:hypothetical protein